MDVRIIEAVEGLMATGFDMASVRARMARNNQHCIDTLNKPKNASAKKQFDGLGISFTDKSPRLQLSEVSSIVSDQQAEIILELLEGVN